MPYLILGLALVVGLFLLGRGIAGADPKLVARILKWTFGILGAVLFGFLLVTGRFYALAEYLIPALRENRPYLVTHGPFPDAYDEKIQEIARAMRRAESI